MITREELIAIGHYNKTHGVAGEISATIDVDMSLLESLSCLVSDLDGIFVPFFVNACRPKTNGIPYVKRGDWKGKQSIFDLNHPDFLRSVSTFPRPIFTIGDNNACNYRRCRT